MFKAWREFWDNLKDNPAYFIARVRSVVFLMSGSSAVGGKRLAMIFNKPWLEPLGEIVGLVGTATAFLMAAGEKNVPPGAS